MPQAPHWRATWSGIYGDIAGPLEDWSFGLSFGNGDGSSTSGTMPTDGIGSFSNVPSGNYQEAVNDLFADGVKYVTALGSGFHAAARLTSCKLALIGADGKYAAEPWVAFGNSVGGAWAGSTQGPTQVAFAVSLTTERRGPTGKGRFFVPANVPSPTALLGMGTGDQTSARNLARTFLQDCNNWPGTEPPNSARVVVASSKNYHSLVTGVRVGRRMDVIRSRAGKMEEAYLFSAL